MSQLQHQLGETMNRLNRPLIMRVDVRAGHGNVRRQMLVLLLTCLWLGAGKPTVKRIEELADTYAFISYALDAKWQD